MKTKYDLFLFDLDDTLLDFRASEKLSFALMLKSFGQSADDAVFQHYQQENKLLWKLLEEGKTTKEVLKVERFARTFIKHNLDIDPLLAGERYLEALPETVVLIDQAVETLEWISQFGEIGIITNGISSVQSRRIQKTGLAPFISFVSVSDDAGWTKPDKRFFEHTVKLAKKFQHASTIIIGDRQDADVLGAHNFGIDSCWFNPDKADLTLQKGPTMEIRHLSELRQMLITR